MAPITARSGHPEALTLSLAGDESRDGLEYIKREKKQPQTNMESRLECVCINTSGRFPSPSGHTPDGGRLLDLISTVKLHLTAIGNQTALIVRVTNRQDRLHPGKAADHGRQRVEDYRGIRGRPKSVSDGKQRTGV